MKQAPFLSVVIPAYNEEHNIQNKVLDSVFSFLGKQNYSWEVVIVDDGSVDQTKKLLRAISQKNKDTRLVENAHYGKAAAVTAGVLEASGEYILFTDFDQATPISETVSLLPQLKKYDIVIGSRSGRRKGAPFSSIVMARGFMVLRNIILGITVEDTQCGFKAFRRSVARDVFKHLRLYRKHAANRGSRVTAGFDVEILFIARKRGFSVKEVPVEWRYVETRRVNPIRDSIEGFRDLLRIKLLDMQGVYD